MSDSIHLHRFINGLHLSGIFLAAIGLGLILGLIGNLPESPKLLKSLSVFFPKLKHLPFLTGPLLALIAAATILSPIYSERLTYLKDNAAILQNGNAYFDSDYPDFAKTVAFLQNKTGRIWPGRPGNWGNDFNVGPIHAFMQFSMAGIDVSGFLPETWSPNSDVEQFFSENRYDHYQAFGIKTIIAPPDHQVPPFAKKTAQFGKFVVYDVPGVSEFELAHIPFQIASDKKNDLSILRLWLESQWPSYGAHPVVSLTGNPLKTVPSALPVVQVTDLSNYFLRQPAGNYQYSPVPANTPPNNLFAQNPFYSPPPDATPSGKIISENRAFDDFSAIVESVPDNLPTYLVLKASFHPSWQATIDGQSASVIPVAPVFMAVKLPPCPAGTCQHTVEFKYSARSLRTLLLLFSLGVLFAAIFLRHRIDKLASQI